MSTLTDAIAGAANEGAVTVLITAAYRDNMAYAEDGSVTKAKAFVTACTAMLSRGIRRIQHGGEDLEFERIRRTEGIWAKDT